MTSAPSLKTGTPQTGAQSVTPPLRHELDSGSRPLAAFVVGDATWRAATVAKTRRSRSLSKHGPTTADEGIAGSFFAEKRRPCGYGLSTCLLGLSEAKQAFKSAR